MDFDKVPDRLPASGGREIVLRESPLVKLWQFDVKPGSTIQYGHSFLAIIR